MGYLVGVRVVGRRVGVPLVGRKVGSAVGGETVTTYCALHSAPAPSQPPWITRVMSRLPGVRRNSFALYRHCSFTILFDLPFINIYLVSYFFVYVCVVLFISWSMAHLCP